MGLEPVFKEMAYDIIGDIHGFSRTLVALLDRLGYKRNAGIYCHPTRKAIFLGDFIDRGPEQREVLDIVRPMIDSGAALAVMGNHEFNAIAYHTLDHQTGEYLRPHSDKNTSQHQAFLNAYADNEHEYAAAIEWFKSLPLWLDLEQLRVVHACWDSSWIQQILDMQDGSNLLSQGLLLHGARAGTWQYEALETLLKGKEIPLKEGFSFKDKDGTTRHQIRIRWWDQTASSYQQIFMGPESARTCIPDDDIEGDHLVEYGHGQPPCFWGTTGWKGSPNRWRAI